MANKEVGGERGDGTSLRSKFVAEFSAADRGDVSTLRDTIGGYKKKCCCCCCRRRRYRHQTAQRRLRREVCVQLKNEINK